MYKDIQHYILVNHFWVYFEWDMRMSKGCDRKSNNGLWSWGREREIEILELSQIYDKMRHSPPRLIDLLWVKQCQNQSKEERRGWRVRGLAVDPDNQGRSSGSGCWGWGKMAQLQMGADLDSAKHFTANTETE